MSATPPGLRTRTTVASAASTSSISSNTWVSMMQSKLSLGTVAAAVRSAMMVACWLSARRSTISETETRCDAEPLSVRVVPDFKHCPPMSPWWRARNCSIKKRSIGRAAGEPPIVAKWSGTAQITEANLRRELSSGVSVSKPNDPICSANFAVMVGR